MDKLLIRFTINQAETETITQSSDQIIHFFAFFTLSSSHQERRYIIPAIIRAITASTDVYLIISPIILPITPTALLLVVLTFAISQLLQPGSPTQLISGFHQPEEEEEEDQNQKLKEISAAWTE